MNESARSVIVAPWATLEGDCLRHVLRAVDDLIVVREADAGTAALVLALPRRMPSSPVDMLGGVAGTELPVLLLVDVVDPWTIALSRSVEAAGLVSWRSSVETILSAVRSVAAGRVVAGHNGGSDADPFLNLSEREREVIALVAIGEHDEEIAVRLGISTHTVRTHVQHSLIKLGVTHRHAAAAMVRSSPLMATRVWNLESLASIETSSAG